MVTAVVFNLDSRLSSLLPSRVGSAALHLLIGHHGPCGWLRLAVPLPVPWAALILQTAVYPRQGLWLRPLWAVRDGVCCLPMWRLEAFKAPASGEHRSSLNPTGSPWGTAIFRASLGGLGEV